MKTQHKNYYCPIWIGSICVSVNAINAHLKQQAPQQILYITFVIIGKFIKNDMISNPSS